MLKSITFLQLLPEHKTLKKLIPSTGKHKIKEAKRVDTIQMKTN